MASIATSLGGWRFPRFSRAARPVLDSAVTMEEAARLSPVWAHVEVPGVADPSVHLPPMFSRHF